MARATIYDVAAKAGVSISTVSLAVNRPDRVSAAARDRVFDAIDELGFVPKSDAVSRARRGVGRIGVVAPFSSYPSFATRLNGVFDELSQQKLATEVVAIDHESAAISDSPLLDSLPVTGRLDGLIIMGITPSTNAILRFQRQGLPMVVVGVVDPDPRMLTVSVDESAGARSVADYLHAKQYERFLYIGEHQESDAYRSQSQLRGASFFDRLHELGVANLRCETVFAENDVRDAEQVIGAALDGASPSVGIFAYCDTFAAGAIRALRRHDWHLPAQAGLVGFDDGPVPLGLGLTTVRQPLRESGQAAARLLLQHLNGEGAAPVRLELSSRLIIRET